MCFRNSVFDTPGLRSLYALKFLLAPPLSEGPVSQVVQGFPYPDDTLKNRHCE